MFFFCLPCCGILFDSLLSGATYTLGAEEHRGVG